MPDNLTIQSALVSYLKANTTITAAVPAVEIRENQWQGTDFTYPNIRVRMSRNAPDDSFCDVSLIEFSILIYSELDSSIEAERIAGIINNVLHTRSFSSGTTRFSLVRNNLVPAVRINTRTWRSEVIFRGTVTG